MSTEIILSPSAEMRPVHDDAQGRTARPRFGGTANGNGVTRSRTHEGEIRRASARDSFQRLRKSETWASHVSSVNPECVPLFHSQSPFIWPVSARSPAA